MFNVKMDSWHFKLMCYYNLCRYWFSPKSYSEFSGLDFVESNEIDIKEYTLHSIAGKYWSYCRKFPSNFCEYWRNSIIFPLVNASITIFLCFLIVSFVSFAFSAGVGGTFFGILGFVVVFFGVFIGMGYMIHRFTNRKRNQKLEIPEKKEPNIFVVKALSLKKKYCPMVNYEKEVT